MSRSPHGERGLKCPYRTHGRSDYRRSPHGERGLKCTGRVHLLPDIGSLSSWRAWIEIERSRPLAWTGSRRSPHGERGLKSVAYYANR